MHRIITLGIAACVAASSFAAAPPDRMHYQGVLRDAAGDPLDGSYDMVFRLWSADAAGDEILIDRHLAINAQAVPVTGGMFAADIGDGEILDGSGPGAYTSLAEVFGAHGEVWLEIQVDAETLSPRLRVASAGYALNAGRFDGRPSGDFVDTSATEQVKEGKLVVGKATGTANANGLEAYGTLAGAYFGAIGGTGYAYVGTGDVGIDAQGYSYGGHFRDSNASGYSLVGVSDVGIKSYGDQAGGFFDETDGSSYVWLARNDEGVSAHGSAYGGFFSDTDDSSWARLGDGPFGISASGGAGGRFMAQNGSGFSDVGEGDYGIQGFGNFVGGYFEDLDSTGRAYLGHGDLGIEARGSEAGGYFEDSNGTGRAYAGFGNYGVQGFGTTAGGYFKDDNSSGYAFVGYGNRGIHGFGTAGGGYFDDTDSSSYAYVGSGSYKILGSGAVSFVQNHPEDADKVVVYHAPESSEVGVYTRGSARLQNGVAIVALDGTFPWVTNPDLGLTAHLTPRSHCVVYVESVTPGDLAVRSDDPACSDAAFDYMVWGLRIGFEDSTPVQPKEREAYIPSMKMHEDLVRDEPELAAFTAGSRFETIGRTTFGIEKADRSAADDLLRKIHVFDPAVDRVQIAPVGVVEPQDAAAMSPDVEQGDDGAARVASPSAPMVVGTEVDGERGPHALHLPIDDPVSAGDLLVVDESGETVIAFGEADPGVIGVVLEDSVGGLAAVATYGISTLKVDADLGAIRRGDLLISSPTPGHAMRAYAAIPGTVIAKALEPLEAGQAAIRVLITPR